MLKPIRQTANGMEYWDTEAKKIVIGGVDLAGEEDKTVVNGQVVDPKTEINLDEMNVEQLLAFAEQNEIDVPGNMKKEETIRAHIAEALSAANDGE